MILRKLHNLSGVELGAISGMLFGILLESVLRSIYLYETHVQEQTLLPLDVHIQMMPYPSSWWYLPLFSLVLITLASFLVHRYFARHIKSSVWLWQVIGLVAVLEACLYSVIVIWYQWYHSQFDFLGIDYLVLIKGDLRIILRVLPVVLGFNLLFALALRFRNRAIAF